MGSGSEIKLLIAMNRDRETPADPALPNQPALYQEVAQGLAYLHHRTNTTSERTLEAASFIYALIELLMEKGLLSLDEIDDRKKQVTSLSDICSTIQVLPFKSRHKISTPSHKALKSTAKIGFISAKPPAAKWYFPSRGRILKKA